MRQARAQAGFSLLEVMVAIAILALAMVSLSRVVTGNVRASQHSRMLTAATFLARTKIASLEQTLAEIGFAEMDGEDEGNFSEEGFPNFRWKAAIERIELPGNATQAVQEVTQKKMTQTSNPMEVLSGFMGSFMTTLMEPIRNGLQESVRRMTVKVLWDEGARRDQTLEISAFLTDPSRLDMALMTGAAAGGTGGASGKSTSPSSSSSSSSSSSTSKTSTATPTRGIGQ